MDPMVLAFAENMQAELDANQRKGDWKEFVHVEQIILELEYHQAKLYKALEDKDIDVCKEFIADTANNLMFLAHALKIVK